MTDTETEVEQAEHNVQCARDLLRDFEDDSIEVKDGSLKHAINELRNARRRLPDDY